MNVEKVGHNAVPAAVLDKPKQVPEEMQGPNKYEHEQDVCDVLSVEQPTNETNEVPGVLRLLQAGHFKGVADVRLRINFHDELAAIERRQAYSVVQQTAPDILGPVNESLQALVESGQLPAESTDAARADLEEAVNATIQGFLDGQIPSCDFLAAELEGVFAAFVSALQMAGPTSTVEGTEQQPQADGELPEQSSVEGVSQEQNDLSAIVEDLTAVFEAAVADFVAAVNENHALPPLSAPEGNGVAYQKFVEIYNALQAGESADSLPETISLDSLT